MPKRPRRVFSAADKLRIVREADSCLASGKRGALEALRRREGIYSSPLSSWRTQLGAHGAGGLTAKKPSREPKLTKAVSLFMAAPRSECTVRRVRVSNRRARLGQLGAPRLAQ